MDKAENFFRFDDITVDVENFRVQKNGRSVALTPRAFDVLLFLLQNSSRVVEKQEIFDQVWKNTFVSDNALTRVIREIRHGLDDNATDPRYIETITKRGYRFIAPKSERSPDDGRSPSNASAANDTVTEVSEVSKASAAISKTPLKILSLVIILGVAVVAAFYFIGRHYGKEPDRTPIDSIAILPFANAAQEPNAEYLCDGITESLINNLSQLSNLKVMSSSAVFRYKGKEQNAQRVGDDLKVRAVLTGSIKQIGDQIAIDVSLDDAKDNHHIWGDEYVRKISDVLMLQTEIANEVSTNLRLKLTRSDEQQLAKRYTENSEAYQLYLKGQYEWKKHTKEDLLKGIEYYNKALEKDPNYVLAYAGLATSYTVLGNDYLPPNDAYPKASIYALRALELDDTLAEPHTAMGAVKLYYDRDWANVEKELNRARVLDPNNADAYLIYGDYLDAKGRLDEALAENKRAQELDPLSPMFNTNVGIAYYYARKYDEAIDQGEKTISLEPRFVNAYIYLGQSYEQKKLYPKAIETFEKGMAQAERHPQLIASLGHAYAMAGDRTGAQRSINELLDLSKQRYVDPYLFAVIYVGLGDKAKTIEWLEKAYSDHTFFLLWLNVDPIFDPIRDDKRFRDLVQRLGI